MRLSPAITAAAALALSACSGPSQSGWEPAFDASEIGWFLNTWGPAPDNLYAVGGTPDKGVMMHYDGSQWTEVDLGVDVPLLDWCYGFGPDDITAVGFGGTVIHWDGQSWTQQATTTDQDLWGVWGASPDSLWAVGGKGRAAGQATLLHYDGQSWQPVTLPDLVRPNVYALFKVWGTSADNVYTVGQRGAVLHYDGQAWNEELVGASDDLISLWGTGPDDIVAVGGRARAVVSRWDGSSWHTDSIGELAGLNGVWTDTPGRAFAVGAVGTLIELDTQTLEYDRTYADTDLDFHSIFSADGRHLVAVGGNLLAAAGPYVGIAYQREAK